VTWPEKITLAFNLPGASGDSGTREGHPVKQSDAHFDKSFIFKIVQRLFQSSQVPGRYWVTEAKRSPLPDTKSF
jgi:hypothetical protein